MRIDIPSSAHDTLQQQRVGMYNGASGSHRRLDLAIFVIGSVTVAIVFWLVINVLLPPF